LIGVESRTAALDFDLTCSYRLLRFENKREFDRLKAFKIIMREAVAEALGTKPIEPDNDTENGHEKDEMDDDDVL